MIVKIGNIFESKQKTLVNTVNCVGVMGKGVALEFKKRYPAMFEEYVALCAEGAVRPGVPYHYTDLCGTSIINFPTKDHWRSPSKLSYIVSGLEWFCTHHKDCGVTSIAFPPLGCGNGGLTWEVVGPLMYRSLKALPIDVEIYAPYGTPAEQLTAAFLERTAVHAEAELRGAVSMRFNPYWLLILYVVQKLNRDRYSLAVGRTIFQKVCYLLTREGIPTGFHFVKQTYGPYAPEVKSAITVLSNANYMSERQLGKMVETVVSPDFVLPAGKFTPRELAGAEHTVDLLSRIKNTEQAELIATVLFSYDELTAGGRPTEQQVFDDVMEWKPRWKGEKDREVTEAIHDLSALAWMQPRQDIGLLPAGHDLF